MISQHDKNVINYLVNTNILSVEQAKKAVAASRDTSVGNVLVASGIISKDKLATIYKKVMKASATTKNSDKIGIYSILSELGRGAMGIVYEVADQNQNKYALKLLLKLKDLTPNQLQRFMQEARTMYRLNHPNIIGIKDSGIDNGIYYLVMDLVKGTTLEQYVKTHPIPYQIALPLIAKLAEVLDYAHKQNIVHRDLKPANIMLKENRIPILMDFGVAKILDSDEQLTNSGTIIGTPNYMSPEQAQGNSKRLDQRSDLYSLGVILYEMLTAKPVAEKTNLKDLLFAVIKETPLSPSSLIHTIPKEVSAICMKAIAKTPEQRFQTGESFSKAIKHVLGERFFSENYQETLCYQLIEYNASADLKLQNDFTMELQRKNEENFTLDGEKTQNKHATIETNLESETIEKHDFTIELGKEISSEKKLYTVVQEGNLPEISDQTLKLEREVNKEFGAYQLQQEIGRGGMGVVYKAFDRKLSRTVALKVLLQAQFLTETQIKRFFQEARSIAKMDHANIIRVFDVGEHPQYYFAMEYIEGSDLSLWIKQRKVNFKNGAIIIKKVAEALHTVHRKGIVHRDIKPSNIMITRAREPKLMDFGLAKTENSQLSQSGDMVGTPAYLSPEQIGNKKIDARTDVYSLGATLYHVLTGRPPFEGDSVLNIVFQISHNEPVAPRILNPDIPRDLETICLKSIEKMPKKRYINASMFAKDLENFLEKRPIAAKPATRFTYFQKWVLRNRSLALTLFLLFLSVVSVLLTIAVLQKNKRVELAKKDRVLAKKEQILTKTAVELKKKKEELKRKDRILTQKDSEIKLKNKELQRSSYFLNFSWANKYCKEYNVKDANKYLDLCPRRLRNWEWYWLKSRLHEEVMSLKHEIYYASDKKSMREFHIFYVKKQNWHEDTSNLLAFISKHRDRKKLRYWNIHLARQVLKKIKSRTCAITNNGKYGAWIEREKNKLVVEQLNGSERKIYNLGYNKIMSCRFLHEGRLVYKTKTSSSLEKPPVSLHVLWSIKAHKPLEIFYTQHYNPILSHNRKLFAWLDKENNRLTLREIGTGKNISQIPLHSNINYYISLRHCFLSKNNRFLILTGKKEHSGREIVVIDLQTGNVLRKMRAVATFCSVNPHNDSIIYGNKSGELKVWDWKKKKKTYLLGKHDRHVESCAFDITGKYLVSSGYDNTVKIWNLSQRRLARTLFHNDRASSVTISPDAKWILSASHDKSIKLWDFQGILQHTFMGNTSEVFFCDFSFDSTSFITSNKGGVIKFWKRTKTKPLTLLKEMHKLSSCDITNDGLLVAVGTSDNVFNRALSVMNLEDLTVKRFPLYLVHSCQFLDKKTILCFGRKSRRHHDSFLFFDISTQKLKREIPNSHKGGALSFTLSPDKKKVLTAGNDKRVRLWDVQSGNLLSLFKTQYPIISLAFSKSGNFLLTADTHGTLFIRSTKNWNILKRLQYIPHTLNKEIYRITSCSFHPKNENIIIASSSLYGNSLRAWNKKRPDIFVNFEVFTGIYDFVLTSNGKRLLSVDHKKMIRVWDMEKVLSFLKKGNSGTLKSLMELKAHRNNIRACALSSDGKRFITASTDHTLKLWSILD